MIVYEGDGLGIAVLDSFEVSLERFAIAVARESKVTKAAEAVQTHAQPAHPLPTSVPVTTSAPIGEQTVAIALVNTADCRIDRCFVVSGFAPGATSLVTTAGSLGVGLGGWALRTRLVENVVFGDVAIGDLTVGRAGLSTAVSYQHLGLAAGYFASVDLGISDNILLGLSAGVDLGSLPGQPTGKPAAARRDAALGPMLHVGATRIADNLIVGPRVGGIVMLGTAGGAPVKTDPSGQGAHATTHPVQAAHTAFSAAVLLGEVLSDGLDRLEISGNVLDLGGIGVVVSPGNVRIDGNDIAGTSATARPSGAGVLLTLGSALDGQAVITDNTIRDVGGTGIAWAGAPGSVEVRSNRLTTMYGHGIAGAFNARVELADVRDNTIENVVAIEGRTAYGIQIPGARLAEVRGNTIAGIGTDAKSASRAGIVIGGCRVTQIVDNVLMRIGPAGEHVGTVQGIAYGGLLEILDIRGNVVELGLSSESGSDIGVMVMMGGDPVVALRDSVVGANDHLVVLGESLQRDNPSILTPIVNRARAVAEGAVFGASKDPDSDPVPPRQGDLAVVDNVLRTTSAMPLVLIDARANVTLAQNRVARASALVGTPAVIARTPGATIVSSNRVETAAGADRQPPSMALFVGSPSRQRDRALHRAGKHLKPADLAQRRAARQSVGRAQHHRVNGANAMAQPAESSALQGLVGQVVEHATKRLTTTANDAQARRADLAKANKNAGNHLRSDDIRAALDAEARLVTDAKALVKRMPVVRRAMSADLERLLGIALTSDSADAPEHPSS